MEKRTKRNHFIRNSIMLALLFSASFFAAAQTTGTDQPMYGNGAAFARITVLEGSATVSRDSAGDMNATRNFTLEPLDILATGGNGRAVVQFIDGTLLKLDYNTKVEFLEIGSGDSGKSLSLLARLWNGAVLVDVSDDNSFQNRSFRIDTEDTSVYFLSNGKYRLDRRSDETTLKVISGSAELAENGGSTLFHSGEMGRASRGYSGVSKSYFNTFDMDNFDLWAMNTYERRPAASARYVPTEIRHYVTGLDSAGTWYYDTSLATYVWHPNIVDVSWEPYSYGYWAWSPYGMTWTSYYDWGFAPFHYGSWDFSVSFGWVWIPGAYYSPAWVSWNCWDNYIGWYPYNSYYYRRYHRGRRVGRYRRHHRIVYTTVDRLTRRQHRLLTRELPAGRNVTRVTRPIAPNPRRLSRQPREAIRNAVSRPITRQIVQKERIVTRERINTRITRGFRNAENRTSVRHERNSQSRIRVENPAVRQNSPIITRREFSRSNRTLRETTRSERSPRNENINRTGTNGRMIRTQAPTIRNRDNFPAERTNRTIRQNHSTGNSREIIRNSKGSSSRIIRNSRSPQSRTIRTPGNSGGTSRGNLPYSRSITVTRPNHSSVPSRPSRSYSRPVRSTPSYRQPAHREPVVTRPSGQSRTTRTYSRPTRTYSRPVRSTPRRTYTPTVHRSPRSTRSSSSGSRSRRH
ncbi:MAG: FecR domain-containing protein [Acidobacteria bacterium]|nr:FecR domain-containing protein [Acidobacteriota bacterium]